MYWRGRLGFPDLTPQMTLPKNSTLPARPEVDPVAKKQFDVLVETLLSRAANVGHLDRIVRQLRNTHTNCPAPPDVHAAADLVDTEAEGNRAEWTGEPVVCRLGKCDGTGFVVDRGESGPGRAVFCQCHPGYVPPKAQKGDSAHA